MKQLTDRRKNQPVRDMINKIEEMLYQDMKSKCRCGKNGYFPKGLCLDCTPINEGGNYNERTNNISGHNGGAI